MEDDEVNFSFTYWVIFYELNKRLYINTFISKYIPVEVLIQVSHGN